MWLLSKGFLICANYITQMRYVQGKTRDPAPELSDDVARLHGLATLAGDRWQTSLVV